MTTLRSIGAVAPGVLVAVLPKCPACLGAYLAFASGLGIPISPGPIVAIAVALLAVALVLLGRAASRANRWPAFSLSAAGAALVVIGRLADAPTLWPGIALIYAGAAWIFAGRVLRRHRARATCG